MMKNNELTDLVMQAQMSKAYTVAADHGFHDVQHSAKHYLALINSECVEAMEADRKNKGIEEFSFELADICIRCFDAAQACDNNHFAMSTAARYINWKPVSQENAFAIEDIYDIERTVFAECDYSALSVRLGKVVGMVFVLAEAMHIDIMAAIEAKTKINENRERLHGNKY